MLLETDHTRRASLTEYEGQIVLAVRTRAGWELEDFVSPEQGQEGIWYIRDDLDRVQEPLRPFVPEGQEAEPRRPLYRLCPESKGRVHMTYRHWYLVRSWNDDIYVPRLESSVYTLVEHGTEAGIVWELVTPRFTLYGVQV